MNLRHLNLKYTLVNIGYMLLEAGTLGFAYNYLSQDGFDDGSIGTTMSLFSFLGVMAGPLAADMVDRSDKISQKMFIAASMALCAITAVALVFIPAGSFLILPVIVISFMCATIGMPLVNGMAFIYERAGGTINYGLCRGIGSAAYAIGSNIVGRLWAVLGSDALPLWVVVGSILTIVCTLLMPVAPKLARSDQGAAHEQPISLATFFVTYRRVVIVSLSLALLFFCHFLVCNYMAKVIALFSATDIETIQGNAFFIQAMAELPTMMMFALLMKRFGLPRILVAASVVYSIKHLIILFCGSVPVFYGAMVLQIASYAAIVPATVYLSNAWVAEMDQNKGQAVFAATQTVGSLVASFVGGWLFQYLSVRTVLAVGVAASVCGTLLMVAVMRGTTASEGGADHVRVWPHLPGAGVQAHHMGRS